MWGYGMYPWRPARGDERKGEVAKECQGYPCWRHDMMMMMMIYIHQSHPYTMTIEEQFNPWLWRDMGVNTFTMVIRSKVNSICEIWIRICLQLSHCLQLWHSKHRTCESYQRILVVCEYHNALLTFLCEGHNSDTCKRENLIFNISSCLLIQV